MVEAERNLSFKKPILLKPNYINARHPSTGITTDSRVIEGVVIFLRQLGFKQIIIGEGSGHSDTFEAFRVAGVDIIANRWSLKMVDLNKDNFIEVYPAEPFSLKKVKIARTALNSTIVSIPKLKIHKLTSVTLSLKNMMGAIIPKGSMHTRDLNKNIADLCSIIKPSIAVVDGIIAGEVHETRGNPVEMNIVIAGRDPVAVDAVGSSMMGVPPETVKHLLYAEQKGLGTRNLNRIKIVGEPINRVRKKFRRSLSSKIIRVREKVTNILPKKQA